MARKKTIRAWVSRDKMGVCKNRVYLHRLKPIKDKDLPGEWADRPGENWGCEMPGLNLKPGELRRVKITLEPIDKL